MLTNKQLKSVFERTMGHCHFCGDLLKLDRYGKKNPQISDGSWELDHVIQRGKGGDNRIENFLPACRRCNQLRWHRKGSQLRELIFIGLIAKVEMNKRSNIGKQLMGLKRKRLDNNKKRRRTTLK